MNTLRISDALSLPLDFVTGTQAIVATKGKASRRKRYSTQELLGRLWERTIRRGGDACWTWQGYTRNGYGSFSVNDREVYLHQLSWFLHFGPISDGKFVLHHCDERRCVRPDHLFLGTQRDNVRDMWSKGRARTTSRFEFDNPKVTKGPAVVRRARALRRRGTPQRAVAAILGVSQSTVWRWTHRETRAAC